MVESALDRRAELMLKYKERIIDGKGIAEKIKGELKQRIIVRQLSKWLPMKVSLPSAWDASLYLLGARVSDPKPYSEIV